MLPERRSSRLLDNFQLQGCHLGAPASQKASPSRQVSSAEHLDTRTPADVTMPAMRSRVAQGPLVLLMLGQHLATLGRKYRLSMWMPTGSHQSWWPLSGGGFGVWGARGTVRALLTARGCLWEVLPVPASAATVV